MAVIVNGDVLTAAMLAQISTTGKFSETIYIGDGGVGVKEIFFDIGAGANNPSIKYNNATGSLEIKLGALSQFRVLAGSTVIFQVDSEGELKTTGSVESNATI